MDSIAQEIRRGWFEGIAWSTVGIAPPEKVPLEKHVHGTGVCVQFRGTPYVVTVRHLVLDIQNLGFQPGDLRFLSRPDVPLQVDFTGRIPRRIRGMHLREAFSLPIAGVSMSGPVGDLAALQVEGRAQAHGFARFHDLDEDGKSPEPGAWVIVFGMAEEMLMASRVRYGGNIPFAIGPYALESTFQEYREELLAGYNHNFDPQVHYLCDFETGDAADGLQTPHGMSGGGAWLIRLPVKGRLWEPALPLVGIQSAWYSRLRLIRVTRVEALIRLLENVGTTGGRP